MEAHHHPNPANTVKKKTQHQTAVIHLFYMCKHLQRGWFKTIKVLIRKKTTSSSKME